MNGVWVKRKGRGIALPAVIFLMVIVTLLVASMSRLLSSETATANLNLQGKRAYWAAQSANEWAAYSIHLSNACPTVPANFTINGFAITLACSSLSYTEGASNGVIYTINTRAVMGNDPAQPDYVSRSVEVILDVH
ncbi:hypothetical protein [Ketobacter sp.]|uniref:hypothetical protein n=1 Tax=Ketobacter sp. TaxID=2083498 RepID=UPI000F0D2F39|nr:hypothetical protein [Ketobacter sp.]RLU01865.1 MAG: pilus assembly protein MshP [Ketobacter sp.]